MQEISHIGASDLVASRTERERAVTSVPAPANQYYIFCLCQPPQQMYRLTEKNNVQSNVCSLFLNVYVFLICFHPLIERHDFEPFITVIFM